MNSLHVCPICCCPPAAYKTIDTIPYSKCTVCDTVFAAEPIDSVLKTENEGANLRNDTDNNLVRIDRVRFHGEINSAIDFGCGDGQLHTLLQSQGVDAVGVDRIDSDFLRDSALSVDAIFMIEVIEHLDDPRYWLNQIHKKLKPLGLLYVETTFSNGLGDLWFNNKYVDPKIGHRVIMSESMFTVISYCIGFKVVERVNDNVFILRKKHETKD